MNLFEFFVFLAVAGVCGAIGQAVAGVSRGGCLVAIACGFIGALLGVWLARQMSLPVMFTVNVGGQAFPIVWSIIGSALFVAVISFFTKGRGEKKKN